MRLGMDVDSFHRLPLDQQAEFLAWLDTHYPPSHRFVYEVEAVDETGEFLACAYHVTPDGKPILGPDGETLLTYAAPFHADTPPPTLVQLP